MLLFLVPIPGLIIVLLLGLNTLSRIEKVQGVLWVFAGYWFLVGILYGSTTFVLLALSMPAFIIALQPALKAFKSTPAFKNTPVPPDLEERERIERILGDTEMDLPERD
jgi:hypothetical protein